MTLNSQYRFYLELPNQGRVRVYPCNKSIKFCWRWNDDLCAWRYELDTALIFDDHKDNPHHTFTALYDLERQCNICYKIPIEIEERCDGQFEPHWKGYLPFKEGDWNESRCRVTIKPRTVDQYTCLLENWKTKKNLFEIEDRVTVDTIKGEIVCELRLVNNVGIFNTLAEADAAVGFPAPPLGYGWVVVENELIVDDFFIDSIVTRRVLYCRQCSTTQHNPTWQLENGQYYGPVLVASPKTTRFPKSLFTIYEVIDIESDNGVTLESAFNYLTECYGCEYPICSDFLNINRVGDAPNNKEYACAAMELSNVVLFQASDIIRPNAEDNARKFEKCIGEIYRDYKERYNLEMFFDENAQCVRIEHVSFNISRKMLDLTQNHFLKCIKGKRKYTYDKTNFPLNEFFEDKIKTSNVEWTNAYIKYFIECSDDNLVTQDKTHKQECSITDIGSIYNNEEYVNNNDILLSMVPIALDQYGDIITGVGSISNETVINYPFAWSHVIEKYWLHDRPLFRGEMNGRSQPFKTTRYQRNQETIQFRMCCKDWKIFKPWDGVKTQFGWGRPKRDEVCRTVPSNVIELTPSFRC